MNERCCNCEITHVCEGGALSFGDKGNDVSLNIGGVNIKESKEEKWLGVILDKKAML